ncbi:kinase-like protein [Amniculicola lignicola CBS 123094]|uniref:Kinase-like protein n=1 Tax=Amniculicola lignicola CBS 123094 TaxID=1392246 RepID=A0A6A5WP08_9PLEO|nr:kinase-like protein [Amniculicola lignicola CBS 123094]
MEGGVKGCEKMSEGTLTRKLARDNVGHNYDRREALAIERAIFDRLSSHPYIVKLLYIHNDMIVLERLQYPLRKRLWDLRTAGEVPPPKDILRWASQIMQALQHVHSRTVLQVDIGPHNMLLDQDENVKLSDFAGSSIDGSTPTVAPSPHSEHPNIPATQPSIQSEIFALGSSLYEMETTQQPYHDKTDKEIEKLFIAGEFPDTRALLLGDVISKCWTVKYKDVGEALRDIQRLEEQPWAYSRFPGDASHPRAGPRYVSLLSEACSAYLI